MSAERFVHRLLLLGTLIPSLVSAQMDVGAAGGVAGVSHGNIRQQIGNLANAALGYAALLAVGVIILAGFYLIFSFGDDARTEIARKMILWTGIGLVVLLVAKIIVAFFLSLPFL